MELNGIELELAAVSASLAAGCHPCMEFHIRECQKLSVSPEQILTAVRHGAVIADSVLNRLWSEHDPDVILATGPSDQFCCDRQSVLCRIGAAVASNSVQMLRSQVSEARSVGIRDSEIMEIVSLAKSIKAKSASRLEMIIDKLDADRDAADAAAELCN